MRREDPPAPPTKPVPGRALDWLTRYHAKDLQKVIDRDYLGWMTEEERRALFSSDRDIQSMFDVNLGEWVLADAVFRIGKRRLRARDLLFGPGGLILDAKDKAWLLEIIERPMSLYEVTEVRPGEGLSVRDLLAPEASPLWVVERAGSQSLLPWDVVGARLARKDGDWVFTGALYPMDRNTAAECLEALRDELKDLDRTSIQARNETALIIAEFWIGRLIAERPPIRLMDAATNTPLLLVTDRYRVKDWAMLEDILSRQADVEGDRDQGWIRFQEMNDDRRRSLASLTAKEDRLEVFCRSRLLADEARAWLEAIAGTCLSYQVRSIQDPLSPEAMKSALGKKSAKPEMPQETETRILHDYLKKHYANWADEPIPKLGNRSPRESVKTPEGRQAVIDLLKEYENLEARRAREQGAVPFDFGFLWESVGLGNKG